MIKKRLLVLGLLPLLCSLLTAADFWTKKDYTKWSKKEVRKMLTNSPWANDQTFSTTQFSGANSPVPGATAAGAPSASAGGSGSFGSSAGQGRRGDAVTSRTYYVRFQSSRPVRMALARNAMLGGRTTPEQAQAFVNKHPSPGYVVVALGVAPGQDRTDLERLTSDLLKNNTYIVFKKSKTRIYVERYLSPVEGGGTMGYLFFPRKKDGKELFVPSEKEFRLIVQLDSKTKLNRKFKLKKMVFNGELEI